MRLWLSELPSWVSFVFFIGVANAVAIASMFGARRWSQRLGVTSGTPVVSAWATCVGALSALLFAFTIVTLWNTATRAHANLDDEAAALRLVARDILPSQLHLVRDYVRDSIAEWPQLCGGKPSAAVDAELRTLERVAMPRSPQYGDDLYHVLGTAEDMRNRRWQAATASVPTEIWVALIILGASLFAVLAIALPDRPEVHLALMISVATALGTLFWVVTVLQYPYCGSFSIGPQEILDVARAHLF